MPPCRDAIRGATRRWHPECSRQSGPGSPCRDVIAFGVPRNANKFESTRQRILDDMSLRKCSRLKCRGATMQGRHSGCHAAVAPRHHVVTPLPSGCHATLINSMRHANAFWMTCHCGNAVVNHVGVPPCRDAIVFGVQLHSGCHAMLISSRRHANAFWMTCHCGNAVVNHVGVPPCRGIIAFGVPHDANKFEAARQRILDDMPLRQYNRQSCRGATM